MFTGIVKGLFEVKNVESKPGLLHYAVELPPDMLQGLVQGASLSIDGVCQTVTAIEGQKVWFDAIQETLEKTTVRLFKPGRKVNVERAAKIGDEIGGQILSGHIYGTAEVQEVHLTDHNCALTIKCPPEWMKFFFHKGYIALDGVSLTVVDVDRWGLFTVHLIPETRRLTTLGIKREGELVNVELDSQTQTIVETVERILERKLISQEDLKIL